MQISSIRVATSAMAVAGCLTFGASSADAQTCYPPAAGCATTTVGPTTTKAAVANTVVVRKKTGGSLARTGAVVVPTALIGVGLVAAGVVLKRSSGRDKASSTPA